MRFMWTCTDLRVHVTFGEYWKRGKGEVTKTMRRTVPDKKCEFQHCKISIIRLSTNSAERRATVFISAVVSAQLKPPLLQLQLHRSFV